MKPQIIGSIAALALCAAASLTAGEVTHGTLIAPDVNGKKIEIPLEHTDVEARISGFVVRVDVTQKFVNPFDQRIEAVYVFPLPENAAVARMTMKIGDRTIKGVIKKREEARKLYEQARSAGQTASLLEQERPNIFTQSVANILPGDTILVEISYVDILDYEAGQYEFVFPMVVGPRYIPGTPTSKGGTGWAPDTDRVPDASRITPPVLKPGQRTGHDISIRVFLNAGVPVRDLRSKSHPVDVREISDSEKEIRLQEREVIPNKDFILSYKVAGPKLETALLTHRVGKEGYFLLILQPKQSYRNDEIRPKEMVFVVDNSGSMQGEPIAKAKEAMRHAIRNLNPNDLFQIIRFSESASSFSSYPLPNTPANREKALHFINQMHGSGGTRMIEGIKAALDYPADPKLLRIVLFMTDGYIGNEHEIFREIDQRLGSARLFSFGVGSAVNRFLLDRMALIGRGAVQYVTLDENTDAAVRQFYDRVANPFLTDVTIDWGRAEVEEVYPSRIPDLFSSQPLALVGRYRNSGTFAITLKGKIGTREVALPVKITLPETNEAHDVLATLWARRKIKDLKLNDLERTRETVERITEVALAYRLMTEYTSFVAVEEQVRTDETGQPVTVAVPVSMPAGVSYSGVFGEAAGAPGVSYKLAPGYQSLNGARSTTARAPIQAMRIPPGVTSEARLTLPELPEPEGSIAAIQQNARYPEPARLAGLEGRVIVEALVGRNGKVQKTRVLRSVHPDLDRAAVAAVRKTRWTRSAEAAWVAVPVVFKAPEVTAEKIVANRTFVKRGEFWVEKHYQGEAYVVLKGGSAAFQHLLGQEVTVRQIFKHLGPNVVFEHGGRWYRVSD